MNPVHLIGNAHLDPVWLWRWQEGYTEVLSTFRSALDRMKEHKDYIFTCAGAAYYSWVEKTDPVMFEEIRARVKEGRWVIVGGWWIQPDCNMPCGESFARHSLYAQRYFQSRFGVTCNVGYNVDSFGHNAMLPQILKLSGMDAYVYMRPSPFASYQKDAEPEKYYPFPENAFVWEGADGTQIPTYRIRFGYNTDHTDVEQILRKARRITEMAEEQDLPQMSFYGVGNHGGGPTAMNLTLMDELIHDSPEGKYLFSSPDRYFSELPLEKLNVLKDDLQNHASGCYTAVMKIKEMNRKAEAQLIAAEKFTAMAELLGLPMEKPDFESLWRTVLFNQFHDIMGGCSIRSAHEDAIRALGGVIDRASEIENAALQKIFWNVETLNEEIPPSGKFSFRVWDSTRGVPVIVFNPHAWDVDTAIQLPAFYARYVTDHEGNPIPMQLVRSEVTADLGHQEGMIHARIPAMGYRVFRVYQDDKGQVSPIRPLNVTVTTLENEWTRLELDSTTGAIVSLFDKVAGKELVSAPCQARVMDESHCDTWAHAVFRFDKEVGVFSDAEISILEEGNVRAVLEVKTAFGKSVMQQKFTMYRDRPGVYVEHYVVWNEQHKMLKLCFPVNMKQGVLTSSIPYGFMDRKADGREYPMQNWVALRKNGYGFGVASDSRCAFDATENELRLTTLRSPIYADHLSDRPAGYYYTDQGEHFFTVYLGAVGEDTLPLQRVGQQLVSGVRVLTGGDHHGILPEVNSVASCSADGVDLTVLKKAEDGSGAWILRCHECRGEETDAAIKVGDVTVQAHFAPQQIRTFRLNGDQITETNLVEA